MVIRKRNPSIHSVKGNGRKAKNDGVELFVKNGSEPVDHWEFLVIRISILFILGIYVIMCCYWPILCALGGLWDVFSGILCSYCFQSWNVYSFAFIFVDDNCLQCMNFKVGAFGFMLEFGLLDWYGDFYWIYFLYLDSFPAFFFEWYSVEVMFESVRFENANLYSKFSLNCLPHSFHGVQGAFHLLGI